MRIYSILASLLLISSMAFGQSKTYTAANEGWLVSLDEAYALSQKTGKPIMANFTGSDWCGWCKRLTASVFSKPEFKKWADKNVVLLELDYPKRFKLPTDIQQQNANMQQSFRVTGFPTLGCSMPPRTKPRTIPCRPWAKQATRQVWTNSFPP